MTPAMLNNAAALGRVCRETDDGAYALRIRELSNEVFDAVWGTRASLPGWKLDAVKAERARRLGGGGRHG